MSYYWLFTDFRRTEIVTTEDKRRPKGYMHSEGGWATMGSTVFNSLEELHAREGARVTCNECASLIIAFGDLEELEAAQLCYSCHECDKLTHRALAANEVIIGGRFYSIGPEPGKGESRSFLGMAGREFHIEYPDGRVIITHNLWAGMVIPEQWRDRLPDTAKFTGGAREVRLDRGTVCWDASI